MGGSDGHPLVLNRDRAIARAAGEEMSEGQVQPCPGQSYFLEQR